MPVIKSPARIKLLTGDIMDEKELWLSFIKSGSVKDYLNYIEFKSKEVKPFEDKNRRAGDTREQYRG